MKKDNKQRFFEVMRRVAPNFEGKTLNEDTKVVRTKEYLDQLNKVIGELYSQMMFDGMTPEEAKENIIFMCNNALENL